MVLVRNPGQKGKASFWFSPPGSPFSFRHIDGAMRHLAVYAYLTKPSDGTESSIAEGVAIDITDQKRMLEELQVLHRAIS